MNDPSLPPGCFSLDQVILREHIGVLCVDQEGKDILFKKPVRKTFGRTTVVLFKPLEKDLSRFNCLAFALRNESSHTIISGLDLIHGRRTFRSTMDDISTSGTREPLRPQECRELIFPRESFGTYGFCEDWTDVIQIRLRLTLEWDAKSSAIGQVCIETITGELRKIPCGPRLSYQGLLDQVESQESLHKLCEPTRTWPFDEHNRGLKVPPPHYFLVDRADQIRAGCILGQNVGVPPRWESNPIGQLEWRHFFHRHHFLKILVQHFSETGLDADARVVADIVESWTQNCPVPVGSNGGAGPSWETLSVAWRMREWLWVFGVMWKSSFLRHETRMSMAASVWESAQSLMDHQGHPNNWIFVESAALSIIGLCFPEFKHSAIWSATGMDRLEREVRRQFFDDGAHFEMSPLYHGICLGALLDVVQTAHFFNYPLPEVFLQTLRKASRYLIGLARPDFTWPSLNDSGGMKSDYSALMTQLDQTIHSPVVQWIGTLGQKGNPPWQISTHFLDSGITVMRSGYSACSSHALFRAGPPGFSHIHNDALSLEAGASGTMWLVDPGITKYAPEKLTGYYRSSYAHNTILIDGRGPRPDSMNVHDRFKSARSRARWLSGDGIQIAAGRYEGPWDDDTGPIHWMRSLIAVKDRYWIVRDLVSGEGVHEITTCWQFTPATLDLNESSQAVRATKDDGAMFEIRPVFPKTSFAVKHWAGSLEPCAGWVSCDGLDIPAPQCRSVASVELPVQIVWLLVPSSGYDDTIIDVHVEEDSESGKLVLEILFSAGHREIVRFLTPVSRQFSEYQKHPQGDVSVTRIHGRNLPPQVWKKAVSTPADTDNGDVSDASHKENSQRYKDQYSSEEYRPNSKHGE